MVTERTTAYAHPANSAERAKATADAGTGRRLAVSPSDQDYRPGTTRLSVVSYAADAATGDVLRRAVQNLGIAGAEFRQGNISHAVTALARQQTPKHLIVDLTGIAQPMEALRDLASVCEPDVVVLAVGERDDVAFYRTVTRDLGVAEYLFKPLAPEVVTRLFGPHLTEHRLAETGFRGGRIVAVAAAHGGAGATTVAANLAVHLADVAHRHVAVVDLDFLTGTTALVLGLGANGGLRQALETPDRVDDLFVERALMKRGERLGLVASEQALDDPFQISAATLAPLLGRLRKTHNFVILDLPSLPALRADVLKLADMRIIVYEPTLAGARGALRHHALLAVDQTTHPLVFALNKAGIPGTFARDQLAATVGLDADVVIPYLPKVLNLAASEGVPAVTQSRSFASSIATLAAQLTPAGVSPVVATGPFARIKAALRRGS
jgi:pilus assembly protein CpaE